MIKTIDGAAFSRMMLSAAAEIDLNKQKVNELNVFPVPDGDTGTNMSMTLSAASTELRKADGITLTKAADKTASVFEGAVTEVEMHNEKKPALEVPQTGDNSHMALWLGLLGISGIGAAAILLMRKRKK